MDIATIIGIFGAFGMCVFSVLVAGQSLSTLIDIPSFLMVVVGSYFALLTASTLSDGLGVFGSISLTFKVPVFDIRGIIQKLISFSEKARRDGLLSLEDDLEDLDDEFLKKGLRLVVDGTDASVIRDLMELELSQMQTRHATKVRILDMWSVLFPGLGMLGTVIGLIGMLSNLEDKASIGPNMALALVTTLYGSMGANLLSIPWSSKLRGQDATEASMKEMMIEGVLSIQTGDNPRILALKLLAYLDPVRRKELEKDVLKD
jgi:chemotaxis protein MotA